MQKCVVKGFSFLFFVRFYFINSVYQQISKVADLFNLRAACANTTRRVAVYSDTFKTYYLLTFNTYYRIADLDCLPNEGR